MVLLSSVRSRISLGCTKSFSRPAFCSRSTSILTRAFRYSDAAWRFAIPRSTRLPIRRGTHARAAAGKIHSDLERGFIRAEVMAYEDFIAHGSEHAVKEAGKFKLEGKDYIVADGDIMSIRFNV